MTLASQEEARQVAEEALRISEAKFRAIFDGITEAVFIHDSVTGAMLDYNRAAQAMFGLKNVRPGDFSVEDISESEHGYTNERALGLIQEAANNGETKTQWRGRCLNGQKFFWIEIFLKRAMVGGKNAVIISCRNIEERKAAEASMEKSIKEREALIQEVHHRVKNNFQIINSLVNLQSDTIVDKIATAALQDTKSRIHAMALVHERLYQSENLSSIDLGSYLQELAQDVHSAYAPSVKRKIALNINIKSIWTKSDIAIPCGLILNELMTNSIKHAFETNDGEIGLSLDRDGNQITLIVSDNGKGFPAGKKPVSGSSLGMSLIDALVSQLHGTIEFLIDQGIKVKVIFSIAGPVK
jgi:PAS domain S-box-containing protein